MLTCLISDSSIVNLACSVKLWPGLLKCSSNGMDFFLICIFAVVVESPIPCCFKFSDILVIITEYACG